MNILNTILAVILLTSHRCMQTCDSLHNET